MIPLLGACFGVGLLLLGGAVLHNARMYRLSAVDLYADASEDYHDSWRVAADLAHLADTGEVLGWGLRGAGTLSLLLAAWVWAAS